MAAFLGSSVVAAPALATEEAPPSPSAVEAAPSPSAVEATLPSPSPVEAAPPSSSPVEAAPSPSPVEAAPPSSSAEPSETQPAGANRFIVKFRDRARTSSLDPADAFSQATASVGGSATELTRTGAGASVLALDRDLTAAESDAVLDALSTDPSVEYAERDVLLTPTAVEPNDPLYGQQWSLWDPVGGANVPAAWSTSRGEGQVVAVVDTGITAHSDLDAQILPGYDLISDPEQARDSDGRDSNARDEGDWHAKGRCDEDSFRQSTWHGTHVAGIVAAATNNGNGISGVAPGAKILPVRALGECGGWMSDISDGVIWAAGGSLPGVPVNPNPARIINLSLGGISTCSRSFQAAVDYANSKNAVVVVAAGDGYRPVEDQEPANCENVVVVGATGPAGIRAAYSNYGPRVDIMAPGGDMLRAPEDGIYSTLNSGLTSPESGPEAETYEYYQGTSMAAPHVSGAVALLLAARPAMSPAEVEARLKNTARELPNGCTAYCGPKLLDAAATVNFPLERTPVPTIQGPTLVGSVLTAVPGSWGPAPVTLAYQWFRDGTVISGATGTTYVLAGADNGKRISVEVTGSKPGYTPAAKRSAATAKVTRPAPMFADVPDGTQFFDEIQWMATENISTGWAEANGTKTYRPLQPVKRDAMAAFMYRLAGSPAFSAPKKSPFTDVAPGDQFYQEITWLASEGISTGWVEANGTRTYRPLQSVKRDAMAAFMYRYADSPGYTAPARSAFTDVAKTSQFYKEISWLASTGISTGWNEGSGKTYRPLTAVNRDAMAAFMNRFDRQFGR